MNKLLTFVLVLISFSITNSYLTDSPSSRVTIPSTLQNQDIGNLIITSKGSSVRKTKPNLTYTPLIRDSDVNLKPNIPPNSKLYSTSPTHTKELKIFGFTSLSEIFNGRLAMIGLVLGYLNEEITGKSFLQQIGLNNQQDQFVFVGLIAVAFAGVAASNFMKNVKNNDQKN
eukprot:gene8069-10932_t